MKIYLAILLSFCFTRVLSQEPLRGYNPYEIRISRFIDSSDSFDRNYLHLNVKWSSDSISYFSSDEYQGWRDNKIIYFFYDSEGIQLIHFWDGRNGSYTYFFKNAILKKVWFKDLATSISQILYFENEKNAPLNLDLRNLDQIARKDKRVLHSIGLLLLERYNNKL